MAVLDGHGPIVGGKPKHTGAVDGGKIWWVTYDYPTAQEIWRDLKNACRGAWVDKSEVEKRIEFPSHGSVTVRSAHEPDKLIAAGLDGVVIDEAGKCPEAAWDFLRPTLADKQGWAIFIGTPRGFNWFYNKFEYAATGFNWARWQQPSIANPLMTAAELAQARLDAPRMYGQEYLARFESIEGAEWPPEYFPESIWFSGWPNDAHESAIALDPSQGKGEKEKGCYASFVEARRDAKYVIWLECWASQSWDAKQLAERMATLNRERRPKGVSTELNGGQQFLVPILLQAAQTTGIPLPLYGFEQKVDKEVRIRSLGPLLAQGRIRIRDTPGGRLLVQQLRDFPVGEFVDCCDAAEMACRLLMHLVHSGASVAGSPVLMR